MIESFRLLHEWLTKNNIPQEAKIVIDCMENTDLKIRWGTAIAREIAESDFTKSEYDVVFSGSVYGILFEIID